MSKPDWACSKITFECCDGKGYNTEEDWKVRKGVDTGKGLYRDDEIKTFKTKVECINCDGEGYVWVGHLWEYDSFNSKTYVETSKCKYCGKKDSRDAYEGDTW